MADTKIVAHCKRCGKGLTSHTYPRHKCKKVESEVPTPTDAQRAQADIRQAKYARGG